MMASRSPQRARWQDADAAAGRTEAAKRYLAIAARDTNNYCSERDDDQKMPWLHER